jgi:hypothetical protein
MTGRRSSQLRTRLGAAVPALLIVAVLLASCEGPAGGDILPPDRDELEGATIRTESTDTGFATLKGGEFRAPVAPGSASELVITLAQSAVGDLDGDGIGDAAAITVEEPGGSGRFRILHALLREEGELHDADTAFLGDRIRVEGVAIHDGVIMVFMLDRPPDVPFAETPSIPVIRKFRLAGETLEELEPVGGQAEAAPGCDDSLPAAALVIVHVPASGEEVASGFEVTGCSRTFESNVVWRLLDRAGEVLAVGHATGGGVDGPAMFAFTVEYESAERQLAHLEVFEEDVSGGEGHPPPRAVVPLIIAPSE